MCPWESDILLSSWFINYNSLDDIVTIVSYHSYHSYHSFVKGALGTGQGGGLHGNFLKIDFLVVSNRGE